MSVEANVEVGGRASLDNLKTGGKQALAMIANKDEWDVTVSRHPLKERITVTISAEIGFLTHYIRVVPEENVPARGVPGEPVFHGHRIEHWHSATPEDGEIIVESGVHGRMRAYNLARDEMERLVE